MMSTRPLLGLRLLLRELRGGELSILVIATVLAVGIVTGIGVFTERLGYAINAQSSDLLGADLVVEAPRPIESDWFDQAQQGLETASSVAFASMLSDGDNFQLSAVRAADNNYPLRGNILVANTLFSDALRKTHGPAAGEVWADARLLQGLNLDVGDTVQLGDIDLTISAVLISEPGGSSGGMAPAALMNMQDLAAAGVVREGSRVEYNYYLAGPAAQLATSQAMIEANKLPEHQVVGVKEGRPRVADALDRAEGYLLLGGALGLVLAGAAIAIASRRYTLQQESVVAILKTLGSQSNGIVALYTQQLLALAAAGIALGWLLGWGLQSLIVYFVAAVLKIALPAAGVKAFLAGGLTGVVCLLAFAGPPLLGLGRVSPIKVLRKELNQQVGHATRSWLVGGVAIFALMLWYTNDWLITFAVFTGLMVTAIIVGGIAWAMLRTTHWAGTRAGSVWRLATASLRRRGLENAIQVVIFAITLMLFLVLLLLRTSLLDDWQKQLPEGTPNHFLINVADEELEPLEQWLNANGLSHEGLYPIVRARITHVNDQLVDELDLRENDGASDDIDREINLTWASNLPADNKLVQGQWWQAGTQRAEVSVEEDIAEQLELKLGDELHFQLADKTFSATVTSIRQVDWEQMRPNFWLILSQQTLADLPATYITSFYLPRENKRYLVDLLRQFPTMAVFEVDAIIQQVRIIVRQVSLAIEAVLWLVIACGALVLVATVRASMEERLRESALLRAVGAKRSLISGGLALEFGILGGIAGVLAAFGAEIMAALLLIYSFEMTYRPQPLVWLLGPFSGVVLVGSLGYMASRKAVSQPPMLVLKELG